MRYKNKEARLKLRIERAVRNNDQKDLRRAFRKTKHWSASKRMDILFALIYYKPIIDLYKNDPISRLFSSIKKTNTFEGKHATHKD